MNQKRLFAVVGMSGSGKSIACDVLKNMSWHYIRFGQLTIDRLQEAGQGVTPENERKMREAIRKQHGMGAYALLCLPKIKEMLKKGNVVIDGLYSWSEYKILKERFGDKLTVICIFASPETRYRRLKDRVPEKSDKEQRMRRLSEIQARERDYSEIENIEKGGPIAMADYTIINESDVEMLKDRVRQLAK
jgi:dephospho-CoA kinase